MVTKLDLNIIVKLDFFFLLKTRQAILQMQVGAQPSLPPCLTLFQAHIPLGHSPHQPTQPLTFQRPAVRWRVESSSPLRPTTFQTQAASSALRHPSLPPCPPSSPTSPSPSTALATFPAPLAWHPHRAQVHERRPRIHIRIHRPLPYIYAGRSTAATTNSSSRPSRSQPWQALRRASSSSSADGHPLRARPGVPAAHPPAGGGARPRLRVPLRLGGPPCCPPSAAGFVFLGGHQVSICLPAALPSAEIDRSLQIVTCGCGNAFIISMGWVGFTK